MTEVQVRQGLSQVQPPAWIEVEFSLANDPHHTHRWNGLVEEVFPDSSACVFYPAGQNRALHDLANGAAGVRVQMPRPGVLYRNIVFTDVAAPMSAEAIEALQAGPPDLDEGLSQRRRTASTTGRIPTRRRSTAEASLTPTES